ncbi:MAG: NBR1-Ig-like domain-containing protein, partial [Gammaproteobacteria bacterium]
MNKKYILITLMLAALLTSCIAISAPTEPASTPLFITSTLPPTKQLIGLPSRTPTNVPGTPGTPTLAITAPPNCKDQAVLLEDVTIPDNTQMEPGKSFTKTWKLQNTGTCPWSGYTLVFADGDRMGAPESTPVPQTLATETVDVSVELVAPIADGAYTGNFSLHNTEDEIVPIGLEERMWVKILVGDGAVPTTTGQSSVPAGGSSGSANCNHSTSAGYVNQILSLINSARANAGLSALTVNPQLTAAAQGHSVDMSCSNMTGHIGSDGSTLYSRIVAAGYSPSYSEEIVYAGGGPQAAFQW